MATVIMEIACSTDEADCRAHLLITEPALMLLLALEHGARTRYQPQLGITRTSLATS
jgi:hypothetical protein